MAKVKTHRWDAAEYLETEEDMAAYLEAALEDGNPQLIAAALGDIARARGMSKMARDTGLGRESLYKALSPDGNPEFATVLKVVRALGLQLHASPERSCLRNDAYRFPTFPTFPTSCFSTRNKASFAPHAACLIACVSSSTAAPL